MDLFDLVAKITLDKSDYEKGLNDAQNKASGFGSKLKSGLGSAAKVGAAAIGAATTAAAGLTTAFAKGVSETASYGDNIDKMSQKLGLSAQAYQQWDYVLQISGASIESMSTGMKTLTNKFDEAVNGGKSAQDTFKRLGLSMEDLAGLSREEVFEKTITAFQGMEDSAERAALANDLFGRSGQELAPLFNTSAEETAHLIDEVNKLGGVMSNDAVKASADFQDNLTALNTGISGLKRGITSEFLPGVNDIISGFTALITGEDTAEEQLLSGFDMILKSVDNVVPRIVSSITDLGGALMSAAPKLLEVGFKLLTSLSQSLSENAGMIADTALEIITVIVDTLSKPEGLLSLIDTGFQIVSKLAEGLAENLPTLIPAIVDIVLNIADKLTSPDNITMLINAALALISGIAEGAIKAIPKIVDKIPTIINNIVDGLTKSLPKIIQAGIELFVSLVKNLPTIIAKIVAVIPQIIGSVVSALVKMIPTLIQAGIDLFISLVQALPEIIKNIVAAIPTIITGITTALTQNIPILIQAGFELFVSLVEALPTIIVEIVKAVPQIVSSLVSALADAGSQMMEAGKNLISGLWDGISNSIQWLKDKISGWVGNVMDFIKGLFGISSPSKWARDVVGKNLVLGIAGGIEKNEKIAENAMSSLVDDLTVPIDMNDISVTRTVSNSETVAVLDQLIPILNRLQAISPGTLVGMIAPDMDYALGQRAVYAGRNLA